ncbi:hypothetical protein [Gorillibacterium massiliense]|uniref:hypothetical protein n=1 Tax=Gorillibacterium massiliense TaxID=1280390 RepID=UPI0004B64F50|nr:hypothetical protein [Gorillibacterium massiliense]
MSLSVNNATTASSTQATSVTSTHKHHHLQTAGKNTKTGTASTDTIEFSEALQMYMAGNQTDYPQPTGNYDANAKEYSLSIDQKKQMLADIQNLLGNETSATSETENSDALSSLKDELSGYDSESTTDDKVSDLFDQVMETLQSMRPERPDGPPPGDRPDGPPPAMTTEQKKAFLTALQEKISDGSSATDATDSSSGASVQQGWQDLLAELKNFDAANTSDDEVANLFQEIVQAARQEQSLPPRVDAI